MLTVNTVNTTTKMVTGKTKAAAVVTIKAGTKVIGTGTADSKGNYKATIKVQKKGTTLQVSVKDKAGNVSAARAVKVV
ncbi:Ig-like domain-containing protein [Fictibacillus sp. b24]|uniref:Ig-like domain-containing protein n=1 Tax=Fictibacillus sp. b24 TaxID=3055863 RepID=UPI0025A22301|nr:Ig-like domain-containing protein [Fictibacillus sp. b24]MDM5314941.1 Ig-like domain-containing protein [Fictibacillus sp. b24]